MATSPVTIRSPGGELRVVVGGSREGPFDLTLDGPVDEVMRGRLSPSFVRALKRPGSAGRSRART